MSQSNPTPDKPSPLLGTPIPMSEELKQELSRLKDIVPSEAKNPVPLIQYTLYYRVGTNPHPQFTFFLWPSADMRIVVERAKRFCDGMNYRFVNVQPSMTDLNSVEARRRESEQ